MSSYSSQTDNRDYESTNFETMPSRKRGIRTVLGVLTLPDLLASNGILTQTSQNIHSNQQQRSGVE